MIFTVTERFNNATFIYKQDFKTSDELTNFIHKFRGPHITVDVNSSAIMVNMPCTRCVNPASYQMHLSNLV